MSRTPGGPQLVSNGCRGRHARDQVDVGSLRGSSCGIPWRAWAQPVVGDAQVMQRWRWRPRVVCCTCQPVLTGAAGDGCWEGAEWLAVRAKGGRLPAASRIPHPASHVPRLTCVDKWAWPIRSEPFPIGAPEHLNAEGIGAGRRGRSCPRTHGLALVLPEGDFLLHNLRACVGWALPGRQVPAEAGADSLRQRHWAALFARTAGSGLNMFAPTRLVFS